LQAKESEVAGTRADITDAVFQNYLNGFTTNKNLSTGSSLNYGNVKNAGIRSDGITPIDATVGLFYSGNGSPFTNDATVSPGYYAFQTTFSSPEISDLSGLFLNIDIDINVDDILEGIFLNGQEITKYSSLKGVNGITPGIAWSNNILDFSGSVLLDDLVADGLFLANGTNTLEFVIRNSYDKNNPYALDEDNPLQFVALGNITLGDQQFAQSFNPTPEPATLLICLTCGGLALAIRRRKNKKAVLIKTSLISG
ncbi:MAG: PEP-CTERM sorting domain-containing protein, partial [Planctomycetaceae bacterium]|nr:PEP-CTERM sorting domain-containing protein [Planctomycetaceae bacterium]